MKKYLVLWMMILVLLLGGCAATDEMSTEGQASGQASSGEEQNQEENSQPEAGVEISCMSFNLLSYNTGGTTYDEPQVRAKYSIPFILETNADIVGLQEVDTVKEFNWKETVIEGTKSVYTARCIDEELEYGVKDMNIAAGLVILYRTDRFTLKDSGCTYYFDDAGRFYQWVLLEDKKSGRDLYVTNTHLSINPDSDPIAGDELRSWEAEELVTFWEETVGDTALFATGDYNARIDTDAHTVYLKRGIYDNSCEAAIESDGESSVDFCYFNTKCMEATKYEMLDRNYTDKDGSKIIMSDHCPIITYAVYK